MNGAKPIEPEQLRCQNEAFSNYLPTMAPIVAVKIASAPQNNTRIVGLSQRHLFGRRLWRARPEKAAIPPTQRESASSMARQVRESGAAAPTENVAADARAIRFVRQGLSLYELNSRVAPLHTCHDLLFHAAPCSSGLLFPSFHSSKSSRSGVMPTELPVISAVRAPSSAKAPNSSNLLDDLCLLGIIDLAQGAGWAGLLSLLPDRGRHLARFWRP